MNESEVESRTQGSRPRTQKNPRPRSKTAVPRTDRPSRGQGQECSRPRTKDTGASVLQKKISSKTFSGDLQNFSNSKNSAALEPRTGQFSKTCGFEAEAKDFKMCPQGLHLWNKSTLPKSAMLKIICSKA